MGDKLGWADWLVGAVGVVVIVIGVVLAKGGVKVDQSIAILIAVGALLLAWPMLSTRLSKLTIGKDGLSFEFKDQLAELQSKIASAQADVSLLATRVERGREARLQQAGFLNLVSDRLEMPTKFEEPPTGAPQTASFTGDPLKGEFGGRSTSNGRALTAEIRPHPTVPEWAVIDLTVQATRGAPRIVDPVTFHLHPTFAPNDEQSMSPDSAGVVRFEVTSYGAFTVGVDTDRGKLELDLATAPGAFEPWKDR